MDGWTGGQLAEWIDEWVHAQRIEIIQVILFQTNPTLVLPGRPCRVYSKRLNLSSPCSQTLTSEDYITFKSIDKDVVTRTSYFALNCSGIPDGQFPLLLSNFLPHSNLLRSALKFRIKYFARDGKGSGYVSVSLFFRRQKCLCSRGISYFSWAPSPFSHRKMSPYLLSGQITGLTFRQMPFFFPSFLDRTYSLGRPHLQLGPLSFLYRTGNCPYRWRISCQRSLCPPEGQCTSLLVWSPSVSPFSRGKRRRMIINRMRIEI